MQKLRMRKRMNLLTTMKRLCDFNFRDRETLKVTIRVLDVEKIFKNNDGIAEKTEELFKNRVDNTARMRRRKILSRTLKKFKKSYYK